jgi:hypothetical protein
MILAAGERTEVRRRTGFPDSPTVAGHERLGGEGGGDFYAIQAAM